MKRLNILTLICVLFGCSPPEQAERQPVAMPDGYRSLKLGMPFNEVLPHIDSTAFNPAGVLECVDDMPLNGCFMPADDEKPAQEREAGIPYRLGLSFNKFDRLTDIDLSFRRRGKITRGQCLEIHERTIDWVSSKYGPMSSPNDGDGSRLARAPMGRPYLRPAGTGDFSTSPMRTVGDSPPQRRGRPIGQWDDKQFISLLSYFITINGEPLCEVGLLFQEPDRIERRKQT